jgi:hypothetical protein
MHPGEHGKGTLSSVLVMSRPRQIERSAPCEGARGVSRDVGCMIVPGIWDPAHLVSFSKTCTEYLQYAQGVRTTESDQSTFLVLPCSTEEVL